MALTSFIGVAPDSDFPLQNLPWGVFSRRTPVPSACSRASHVGVALGDVVVDVTELQQAGLLASGPHLTALDTTAGTFSHVCRAARWLVPLLSQDTCRQYLMCQ
jgi:fumarylacetoacetase